MNLEQAQIDKIYQQIGVNVKTIREKHGLSQLDLALNLGYKSVSVISLGELYKNKKHFNITQLAKIAKLLNVDICDFFDGVDEIINQN
ncbi:MAG: helix-turn-helix transcriptional regulator [Epsilonproteobacteria bacterium]|nr:helix-turn-helix transcriptional regulator [Campylobacterota bacterium]